MGGDDKVKPGLGQGARKVDDNIMKAGRAIIVTETDDSKIVWDEIPNGALRVDPVTGAVTSKLEGATSWTPITNGLDGQLHPSGSRGQMLFLKDNFGQAVEPDNLIHFGAFINTAAELADAKSASSNLGDLIYDCLTENVWLAGSNRIYLIDPIRTVASALGVGRMLINSFTSKVFFVKSPSEVVCLFQGISDTEKDAVSKVQYALDKRNNLSDVGDRMASLASLKLVGNVSEHNHDSMYLDKINQEILDRKNADAAEAIMRAAGEASGVLLDNKINQEIVDRKAADIVISNKTDVVDADLSAHIGKGGTTVHPIVTDFLAGFMSPGLKAEVDLLNTHSSVDGRIINVAAPTSPTDAVNLDYVNKTKDSFNIRTARYKITASSGLAPFTIDMQSWKTDWDAMWAIRYPGQPNPGFQVVVIPAITRVSAAGGGPTGTTPSDYSYLITEIVSITRITDTKLNVIVNVTGSTDNGATVCAYSCRATGAFTFTVLGASKNMFQDDGALN